METNSNQLNLPQSKGTSSIVTGSGPYDGVLPYLLECMRKENVATYTEMGKIFGLYPLGLSPLSEKARKRVHDLLKPVRTMLLKEKGIGLKNVRGVGYYVRGPRSFYTNEASRIRTQGQKSLRRAVKLQDYTPIAELDQEGLDLFVRNECRLGYAMAMEGPAGDRARADHITKLTKGRRLTEADTRIIGREFQRSFKGLG